MVLIRGGHGEGCKEKSGPRSTLIRPSYDPRFTCFIPFLLTSFWRIALFKQKFPQKIAEQYQLSEESVHEQALDSKW